MFEAELALVGLGFGLAAIQQGIEDRFEQLPGPVLICVAQCGAFRRLGDAQVAKFSFTRRQTASDLAQALGVSNLAKQHGDHLRPTGKAARMPLGLMLPYCGFKLQPWN